MHVTSTLEFPEELKKVYRKGIIYEWISFFYMCSVIFFLFLTMGESQTMKTVLYEDVLSLIPPISFLIASKLIKKPANKNFPYGFHKVTGISYLASSIALLTMGIYLIIDSFIVLFKQEHPTIGLVSIGNHTIWLGYLMMLALLWKSIPNTIFGHIKHKLSLQLYDKILFTDSKMNKADWMTGLAGIVGILGVGMGYWWADSVIAMLIAINIVHDGYTNVRQSILDLIDEIPKKLDSHKTDPILAKLKTFVSQQKWVEETHIRFRDEGHVFFGEIFIKPKNDQDLLENIKNLYQDIREVHWRIHDVVIVIIPK